MASEQENAQQVQDQAPQASRDAQREARREARQERRQEIQGIKEWAEQQDSKQDNPNTVSIDEIGNKFDLKSLSFPKDLLADKDNQYGYNYVTFLISTKKNSPFFAENKGKYTSPFDSGAVSKGIEGEQWRLGTFTAGYAAIGGFKGGALGKLMEGQFGNTSRRIDIEERGGAINPTEAERQRNNLNRTKTVVSSALGAGYSLAKIGALKGLNTKPGTATLKTAITLYMPNEVKSESKATWESKNLTTFAALGTGDYLGWARNYLLQSDETLAGFGKLSGVAPNPKAEQLFQNVDFRTFTYKYMFTPRDPQEAQIVRDIIKTFRLHMHPESGVVGSTFKSDSEDIGNLLYHYPSTFNIVYCHHNGQNKNLHKIADCALTSVDANYSPTPGAYASFWDGMPTQIEMTLTFKELVLLTKSDIDRGF